VVRDRDLKGSCQTPVGSVPPRAGTSKDQVGLRDLQSEMSSLHDDPRYFGVGGTGPAKVAVEALRGDAAAAPGARKTADCWHMVSSIASTARSA
jgi:hypothetical protein